MSKILIIIIGSFFSALACLAQSAAIPNNLPLTAPCRRDSTRLLSNLKSKEEGECCRMRRYRSFPISRMARFRAPQESGSPVRS